MTTNANLKEPKEEIKALKDDIADLKNTLSDYIKANSKEKASKISNIADKTNLEGIAKETGKKVYAIFNDGQKHFEDTKNVCEEKVKENPFIAIGASFVLGALLTAIIKK